MENMEESKMGDKSKESGEYMEINDPSQMVGNDKVSDAGERDMNLVQTTNLNYSASQLNPLLKETQKPCATSNR